MAAIGAVFFFVELLEQDAHVVVDRTFQVFQQLFFRHIQQAQLEIGAGFGAVDHVMQAAPRAFQLLEVRVVHQCIELVAEDLVDLGDAFVDHRDDALVRRRLHAFVQHLGGELPQQFFRVCVLRWLDCHLAFQDDTVQQAQLAGGLDGLAGTAFGGLIGGHDLALCKRIEGSVQHAIRRAPLQLQARLTLPGLSHRLPGP